MMSNKEALNLFKKANVDLKSILGGGLAGAGIGGLGMGAAEAFSHNVSPDETPQQRRHRILTGALSGAGLGGLTGAAAGAVFNNTPTEPKSVEEQNPTLHAVQDTARTGNFGRAGGLLGMVKGVRDEWKNGDPAYKLLNNDKISLQNSPTPNYESVLQDMQTLRNKGTAPQEMGSILGRTRLGAAPWFNSIVNDNDKIQSLRELYSSASGSSSDAVLNDFSENALHGFNRATRSFGDNLANSKFLNYFGGIGKPVGDFMNKVLPSSTNTRLGPGSMRMGEVSRNIGVKGALGYAGGKTLDRLLSDVMPAAKETMNAPASNVYDMARANLKDPAASAAQAQAVQQFFSK